MPDFVLLTCPSCGSKLQITDDIDRFACNYCGNELIVKRGGGITSLKPVIDSIKNVQKGVDKTASELAIKRLEKEIAELKKQKNYKLVLEELYESTKFGYTPRCKSVVEIYFLIEFNRKTKEMGFLKKLSHDPKTAIEILNLEYDELINMHDYFQKDQLELYKKYDVYFGRNPHQIEVKRFNHFRELLKPITKLKEKVDNKEAELRKHRDVVSS